MADVEISFEQLQELDQNLQSIMKELQDAESRGDALTDAIDRPFDQSKLRDRAHDFEDGWKNRRADLAEDLGKVAKHVHEVVSGFKNQDVKGGQAFGSTTPGGTTGPHGPR